jgi:DNA-binding NarL/FixJ family response regulator
MKWRVVVVDDQDDIRFLVRLQLDQEPQLQVVGDFADADSAISAIPGLQPDVVVLDQLLGQGETGVGVYQAITAAAPTARIVFHVGDPTMIDGSVPATEIVPKGGDIAAAVLRAATADNTVSPEGDQPT